MRESIGGAFLIKIMVFFIVIYNSLLAIAINYAIVFRVKNQIINLIEQYEGYANAAPHIANYVSKVGYYRGESTSGKGYNIEIIPTPNRGTYYRVTTYITFSFPIIRDKLSIDVTGETKLIYGLFET